MNAILPTESTDRVLETRMREKGYAVAEAAFRTYEVRGSRVNLTLHELAGLVGGGYQEGALWQQERTRHG